MSETAIQRARNEMAYEHTENHVMGHEYPVSIPAQLRFLDDPEQNVDRFHDALEERGWTALDSDPGRRWYGDGPYYEGEVCPRTHYNRIRVLVFRGRLVRLFPHDDHVPSEGELADLVAAIEAGFGASLEHYPIEREGTNARD